MANPNIVNVSNILGKTSTLAVSTEYAPIVTAAANTIVKVNVLMLTPVDTVGNSNISVRVNKAAGTDVLIAKNIIIPNGSTLTLIAKDTALYLEEGDSLEILDETDLFTEATCSYEIIS